VLIDAPKANPDTRTSERVARVEEASPATLLEPLGPDDDLNRVLDTGDADPEFRMGTHGWWTETESELAEARKKRWAKKR
jgi:hypothetical protein